MPWAVGHFHSLSGREFDQILECDLSVGRGVVYKLHVCFVFLPPSLPPSPPPGDRHPPVNYLARSRRYLSPRQHHSTPVPRTVGRLVSTPQLTNLCYCVTAVPKGLEIYAVCSLKPSISLLCWEDSDAPPLLLLCRCSQAVCILDCDQLPRGI